MSSNRKQTGNSQAIMGCLERILLGNLHCATCDEVSTVAFCTFCDKVQRKNRICLLFV